MIIVGPDQQESVQYGIQNLPVAIYFQEFEQVRGDELPLHWHEEWQISWVYEGELLFSINQEELLIDANQLLVIPSKLFHQARLTTSHSKALCFNFLLNYLTPEIVTQYLEPIDFTFITMNLTNELYDWLKTVAHAEPINPLFAMSFITQVLGVVSEKKKLHTESFKDPELAIFSDMLMFIQTNYQRILKVEAIAASGHVSKSKCTTMFKRYTKLSPINYLNEYRLQKARKLLQTEHLSITEISQRVGFNQLSYFVSRFKQKYGKTPLQYQKNYF